MMEKSKNGRATFSRFGTRLFGERICSESARKKNRGTKSNQLPAAIKIPTTGEMRHGAMSSINIFGYITTLCDQKNENPKNHQESNGQKAAVNISFPISTRHLIFTMLSLQVSISNLKVWIWPRCNFTKL